MYLKTSVLSSDAGQVKEEITEKIRTRERKKAASTSLTT